MKFMSNIKCYILDSNIIMRNPDVLNGFADNEVVMPELVQRELNHLKCVPGQKGYEARQAVDAIDQFYMRSDGNPKDGWKTEGGGIFRIESRDASLFLPPLAVDETDVVDNRIIATAVMIAKENGSRRQTKLISGDRLMRQLARNAGITAEVYRNEEVRDAGFDYPGWTQIDTDNGDMMDRLYNNGKAEIDPTDDSLDVNEYAVVRYGKSSALARYSNGLLIRLTDFSRKPVCGVTPLNARQSFQLDACTRPAREVPCVIIKGAAGTGKTFLAEAAALDAIYSGDYDRIVITRSMVNPDGEGELGILPGDPVEKMDPYLKPFYDNFEQLSRMGKYEDPEQVKMQIDDLMAQGLLEIQPMGSIRGRTFAKSYIIIDEAQNTSAKQIETLITRLGEGSKIVILGDLNQIDTSRLSRYSNGLAVASDRMRGSALTAQVLYMDSDVRRSPLAKDAVQRFSLI